MLINFFLTEDQFSIDVMADVVEAYRLYGCNQYDVFFMEISPNGHDDACQAWANTYDVEFPTISRDGGGNDIAQAIPVAMYPTIMIIRPDHTFAQRDVYPPTLEYIIQTMDAEGYEQHECIDDGVDENSASVMLFPNPANESLTLKGERLGNVTVYNALGQKMDEFKVEDSELSINTAKYQNGVYFVKVNDTTLRFVVAH